MHAISLDFWAWAPCMQPTDIYFALREPVRSLILNYLSPPIFPSIFPFIYPVHFYALHNLALDELIDREEGPTIFRVLFSHNSYYDSQSCQADYELSHG